MLHFSSTQLSLCRLTTPDETPHQPERDASRCVIRIEHLTSQLSAAAMQRNIQEWDDHA